MNPRILKIDPYKDRWSGDRSEVPTCTVEIRGSDKDGDFISIDFTKEDAGEIVELLQALARQSHFTVEHIKDELLGITHQEDGALDSLAEEQLAREESAVDSAPFEENQ